MVLLFHLIPFLFSPPSFHYFDCLFLLLVLGKIAPPTCPRIRLLFLLFCSFSPRQVGPLLSFAFACVKTFSRSCWRSFFLTVVTPPLEGWLLGLQGFFSFFFSFFLLAFPLFPRSQKNGYHVCPGIMVYTPTPPLPFWVYPFPLPGFFHIPLTIQGDLLLKELSGWLDTHPPF